MPKMVIPSRFEAARAVEQSVLDEMDKHGYSECDCFAVKLALEESLNNAIKHGNRLEPEKPIQVSFDVDDAQVVIVVVDQGRGFDRSRLPNCTADENLEKPTGRGIMLMRCYMDEVRFNERGNEVTLVKRKC